MGVRLYAFARALVVCYYVRSGRHNQRHCRRGVYHLCVYAGVSLSGLLVCNERRNQRTRKHAAVIRGGRRRCVAGGRKIGQMRGRTRGIDTDVRLYAFACAIGGRNAVRIGSRNHRNRKRGGCLCVCAGAALRRTPVRSDSHSPRRRTQTASHPCACAGGPRARKDSPT
jgi:hypothetical protein